MEPIMVISKENKDFINSLIDYYISESGSYKQIAENFVPEIKSVPDTAFGIITGCVYSGFLQAYQNQQQTPSLEDMKEFNQIIKERAPLIKKSILEPSSLQTDREKLGEITQKDAKKPTIEDQGKYIKEQSNIHPQEES
ncbi:MAG: hypothetical protein OER82_03015 [Nitrosopumilus sp.]|nr:hypothetical protein [Nitrosopumilus sp.]